MSDVVVGSETGSFWFMESPLVGYDAWWFVYYVPPSLALRSAGPLLHTEMALVVPEWDDAADDIVPVIDPAWEVFE